MTRIIYLILAIILSKFGFLKFKILINSELYNFVVF